MQKLQVITTAPEFLSYCHSDKKVKIMEESVPLSKNLTLFDISLHKKGPLEDKMLLS